MADENEHTYAERMFPAPVDHGIARPDRAVSSVPAGTSSYLEGAGGAGKAWYEGGGGLGEKAVQEIVIYPPTGGLKTQGDPWEPVKIGILVDMDLGQLLADWLDPTILAIEDAMNEGVWGRSPVALITADARGLPRENYRKVIAGYEWLVEQGCVVILGPMISDNSLALQDTVNRTGVPVIGWTGAHKFSSDYCFTIANGDIPTEGVICANWFRQRGIDRVGLFWEAGSSGGDYAEYFRQTALRLGITVTREVMLEPNPRNLEQNLREMRDSGTAGRLLRRATATRRSTSPRRSARSTGIRRASWAPRSCSIRTRTSGPPASRAGTASTSSAKTAPTRTTRRCAPASRPASGGRRATSSSRSRTTPRGRRSTGSRTRSTRCRGRSATAWNASGGCRR